MKRNIFMMAAIALLAMACTKEQQPVSESQNNSEKVFLYASVEKTKAVVDHDETGAQKGTVAFEAGDKMSVWFQTGTETTGEGEEKTETPVGKVVEFTYESEDAAGFKFSAGASLIPEGFTLVKAAYPAGSLNSKGVFSLIRDYTYDPDSMPIYVRADEVIMNENGTLSADLKHNASVFKFTLGDIPAYAAGFVLESQKYERDSENEPIQEKPSGAPIKITTTFPYKTGYSEDITLYSVSAHSSYLTRVYLIDGDGDEIEGSERKFKQSWNDVSKNDFIIMPRIDFNKAELRKDFVKVCGVKWAKGNLQCIKDNGTEGFQEGWRLAPAQWYHFNYNLATNTVDKVEYTYNDAQATEMRYSNNGNQFEHFNFGGLARNARFYSAPGTNYMVPEKELNISGKIFTDSKGNTEATGDARFYDCGTFTGNNSQIWGDLAFWASKGKFRVPTKDELSTLYSSKLVSKQYGHYDTGDYNVWGILFTTALGEQVINKTDVVLTDADLESGLFLPLAGRRRYDNSSYVMTVRTQGVYWSGAARWNPEKYPEYTNHATILQLKGGAVEYGYTLHATQFQNSTGCLIRPVLVEESAE